VDRTKLPWLITVLHAPWYNSNSAHQHDGDAVMAAMEFMHYNAHINIVFAGHLHAYEHMVSNSDTRQRCFLLGFIVDLEVD